MEKFFDLLPKAMVFAFLLKMFFIVPSIADVGILTALSAICIVQQWLSKHTEIQNIKTVVNKQNEVIQTMAIEISKIKNVAEGLKIKEGFKNAEGFKRSI